MHETRSSVRVGLFASSFAPPPPQLHGSTLLNSAQLRCSTLLNSTLLNSAQLCSTLLNSCLCFIGSASARAAQIPSICPPRHLLSSQPQLRLGMSSPVTAARLRSCLPLSTNTARPARRPRAARRRSPCRSPPAGYSRGNQTQNPVGK